MNKIANVENVVCSVETLSRPELYHYTSPAAFEGIARSQTLWCSHFRAMTDDKEIELARSLLTAAVAPRMDTIVNEGGFNREIRRKWNAFGGGKQTAHDLVNSLYGAYLPRQSHLFNARTLFVFVLDTCRRHSFRTGAWGSTNGRATRVRRGSASCSILGRSRTCSSKRATHDIGLG